MNLKFKSVFSIFIAIMIVFLLNSIAYAEDTNGVLHILLLEEKF